MKLADWLKEHRISRTEFAGMIGVSRGRITHLCDGSYPSISTAERIAKATDGAVTANDFMRLEGDIQPTS